MYINNMYNAFLLLPECTSHQGSTKLYVSNLVMSVMMMFGNLFGGY